MLNHRSQGELPLVHPQMGMHYYALLCSWKKPKQQESFYELLQPDSQDMLSENNMAQRIFMMLLLV